MTMTFVRNSDYATACRTKRPETETKKNHLNYNKSKAGNVTMHLRSKFKNEKNVDDDDREPKKKMSLVAAIKLDYYIFLCCVFRVCYLNAHASTTINDDQAR